MKAQSYGGEFSTSLKLCTKNLSTLLNNGFSVCIRATVELCKSICT